MFGGCKAAMITTSFIKMNKNLEADDEEDIILATFSQLSTGLVKLEVLRYCKRLQPNMCDKAYNCIL